MPKHSGLGKGLDALIPTGGKPRLELRVVTNAGGGSRQY